MESPAIYVTSFLEVISEFWALLLGALAGAVLLYAMYLGRRGETAKAVPTYGPEFALGAFGFNLAKKSPALGIILSVAFLILCGVIVYIFLTSGS